MTFRLAFSVHSSKPQFKASPRTQLPQLCESLRQQLFLLIELSLMSKLEIDFTVLAFYLFFYLKTFA